MISLIINADDVGLSGGINDAAVNAYSRGLVTGVSVIACGPGFQEGAAMLRDAGRTEAGAHLALTGSFTPCTADVSRVDSLITREGVFPADYMGFFGLYLMGRIRKQDIRAELKEQIERIRGEGLEITHLDSHEHVHVFPGILEVVSELAREYGIPYVRSASEDPVVMKKDFRFRDLARYAALKAFGARTGRRLDRSGIRHNDRFLGHFHSGRLNKDVLFFMADNLKEGVTELAAHPGLLSADLLERSPWHANAQTEMEALADKDWADLLSNGKVRLVTHREAFRQS